MLYFPIGHILLYREFVADKLSFFPAPSTRRKKAGHQAGFFTPLSRSLTLLLQILILVSSDDFVRL